ncbi:5-formyltetrahydrofolate cyclo-ligase [Chryseomicrobium aureum]|uniref:5-formyltetrahydrofolate cyclo-ligase n=1 Tax=Chryseomicrobium aureum TaxID=1441723 RepID=UPI001959E84B|nr:5-formyltetrahydrofolate cyclo-ligase [Chryseomicrobium aureum]MBM7705730.1 5-formyltetrahydrofolate cyclo-ligase [Chryseomicrobium aureum]
MKRQLRIDVLNQLQNLSKENHAEKSTLLHQHVWQYIKDKSVQSVAVTISSYPEVDTKRLIEWMWEAEKDVYVPKSDFSTRQMKFIKITSWNDVKPGFKGILEPIESSPESTTFDLVIVPGVVFSKDGYRIGFGGGFYDRFLEEYKGETLSLAFETQLRDAVPYESHDIPVKHLVLQDGIFDTSR